MNKRICHSCSFCRWSHSGFSPSPGGSTGEFGDDVGIKGTAAAQEHCQEQGCIGSETKEYRRQEG